MLILLQFLITEAYIEMKNELQYAEFQKHTIQNKII